MHVHSLFVVDRVDLFHQFRILNSQRIPPVVQDRGVYRRSPALRVARQPLKTFLVELVSRLAYPHVIQRTRLGKIEEPRLLEQLTRTSA